jgi:fibronectin-binding autotransporter adhesin
MKSTIPWIHPLAILTTLVTLATVPTVLGAGTDTWAGNSSLLWSLPGNWTTVGGSTPPANGDSLIFGAAGSAGTALNNDLSGLSINNLNINGPDAFTFGGNAIAFNGTLTDSANAIETINLFISGNGNVVKSGGGILTLSGANTYTGGTTNNFGTLQLGANNPLGTGAVDFSSGGSASRALDFNGYSLTNALSEVTSGNNLVFTNSGLATATNSGNFAATTISDFTIGGNGDIWWSGGINRSSSSLTLTKTGTDKVSLIGTSFSGINNAIINGGTLVLGATGSTLILGNTVTINSGGTLQYNPNYTTSPGSDWPGQINSGVIINSGGVFDLNGTSGNNNRMQWIESATGGLLTNSSAVPATLVLRERGGGPHPFAGAIGGNLSLSWQYSSGPYTANLSGNNSFNGTNTITTGIVALSGNNTTPGSTVVSGGTLALNSSTALGTSTLTISGGAIDNTSGAPVTQANNNVQNWTGSFTFIGTTNLNLGTGAVTASSITVTANTNTLTVGGVVSGGANTLTTAGTGTLQLTSNNTWGNATVNAGNLLFGGTSTTPTESLGLITIGNNGGTLGSQMIFSNTTVNITGANNTTIGGNATSTNNTLKIQASTWNGNGQRLELTAGVGNAAIIDNSIATNFTSLIGGNSSQAFGTTLIVTNGGKLYVNATAGSLYELGRNTGANSNNIIITGAGSAWYSLPSGAVGFTIGGNSGTVSNNVVQVNNGGLWDCGGGTRLNFDNYGAGLSINGGIVTNVYSMIVGNNSPSNYFTLAGGGKFYFNPASAGSDFHEIGRGGTGAIALLTDAGTVFNAGGATLVIGGTQGGTFSGDIMTVAAGAIYTNGNLTVGGQGTGHSLVISNGTAYVNALTVNGSANVFLNGGSGDALYVDNFSSGSSSSFIIGTAAGTSSLIAGWENSSSSVTPLITGNLALTKQGSGALTLLNANTYSGSTTVNAGELVGRTGGSCANSAVTVTAGATNGVSLAAANGHWTCAGLAYTAGTTYADFNFGGVGASTTTAPLQINGNLTVNAAVNILSEASVSLTVGTTYPLMTWTGTGPADLSGFGIVSLPGAMPGTLSLNTGTKTISVVAGIHVPNLAFTNAPGVSRFITTNDMIAAGLASAQSSPIYTVTGVGSTTAGGIVSINNNIIKYAYPASGSPASDSFSYTVSDGTASASATVTITFANAVGPQLTPVSGGDGLGHAVINFHGIPGYGYHVQRATTLSPTPDWTNAAAITLSPTGDGSYSWTNTVSPEDGYYRLSYP